ncbi:hypothetical protein ACIBK9_47395 [Nonomuraea sp. NPDC050227]|uniref:hypothetical protein n=1 Tax=Nonomuraea sp. NPDC050227 TaxID=3364360 RepID=UPI0037AB018C
MDTLEQIAAFLNTASGGTWLLAGGVITVLLTVAAVAWMFRRSLPVEEMADPAYNPGLDRHQRVLREVFRGEAERYPVDLHDVFEEDR